MKPELGNQQRLSLNAIDEAVLVGDPARPEACECVLQRLWLPIPVKGERWVSRMSALIRSRMRRSCVCQ